MPLDLYLGPMFAGKSTAILGIIRRNKVIGRKTLCLTSAIDRRYSKDARIMSHNLDSAPAVAVTHLTDLIHSPEVLAADCIIIEEAQFFPDLKDFVLPVIDTLQKHVICVGLDGDSSRRPFGQLLDLVPYADTIQKLTALCARCADGTEAIFTYRQPGAPTTQVNVGAADQYEPLCRRHFLEGELDKSLATRDRDGLKQFFRTHIEPVCRDTTEILDRLVGHLGMDRGSSAFSLLQT